MSFVCSVCGEVHEGLSAWAYRRPDPWLGLSDEQKAQGQCTDDLCRTPDGDFFVRAVLKLPLIGGPDPAFEFGVWGSLSETNFRKYIETFDADDQSRIGSMFSFLSNEVRGFPDSFALKATLHAQDGRKRPLMEIEPTDHPLAIAQRDGIAFSKVLDIIYHDEIRS